jgi:RHS repeat-associated protein
MRGSVIALTDDTGNIAETYSYDPFGNILSTPTIYNSKLFIGRDDILYDTETDLYYMHARYYDPEAGRFIMKDQTEGSPPNYIDGKKTPESEVIETAINQALWEISCDTDYFVSGNMVTQLGKLINDMASFTNQKRPGGGNTFDAWARMTGRQGNYISDFFYHATRGAAIGELSQHTDHSEFDENYIDTYKEKKYIINLMVEIKMIRVYQIKI